MRKNAPSVRKLKQIVADLLRTRDMADAMAEIGTYPPRRVINPLLGLLFRKDDPVQQRAISAIGMTTAQLAESDIKSARVIMRRLMWSLNDESGGIGWGAPEAMGEIMARHPRLAEEYHHILLSYIAPDKNYLELDELRFEALNGIRRLSAARPGMVKVAAGLIESYKTSPIEAEREIADTILDLLR